MAIYDKLNKTMLDRDVKAYLELLNEFAKSECAFMVTDMMTNEKFIQDTSRCIYENDEI